MGSSSTEEFGLQGEPGPHHIARGRLALRRTADAAATQVRSVLAPLSPGHRRWKRFLRSLPLNSERLPLPLEGPGPNDFIICGSPRTGTTLLCAALFQPPTVVTVMEPWDGMRVPPADLFRSLRQEIGQTGRLTRGRLDIVALQETGVARWCQEGSSIPRIEAGPDYALGVKWPGYWRYLRLLPTTKFLVCIRHPFDVVASYRKAGGRLALGLQYETAFDQKLNEELRKATRSRAQRRVLLYDYVNERIQPFLGQPNVQLVRYERWFSDPDELTREIGRFLGVQLSRQIDISRPAPPELSAAEIELIRSHCRTAAALGYSLEGDQGRLA